MPVPKMIIQTYTENAVKHGLFPLEKQGKLTIGISEAEGFLTICVEDNGIGRKKAAESKTKSTGKGMKIMKQYFEVFNERNQEKITFEIVDLTDENREACGTKVIIKIPLSMRFEI
jgi:LytS/YehU family sensor histidine kinase